MNPSPRESAPDRIDRFCEFANIGAGHAADALAAMVGTTLQMKTPRVLSAENAAGPEDESGIFFEVDGGPGGFLGVFFSEAARDTLLETLLGGAGTDAEMQASALAEVGNILASHALSAVAGTEMFEFCMSDSPLRHRLTRERFQLENGYLAAPDGPGLGVTVDEAVLEEFLMKPGA